MQLPEDIKFIAVEGVIGVGKTTFSEFLAERLQGRCMLEEFEENPFLERFYQDRDAYAFQTQLFFFAEQA
jgi:deoxyguanosine kinase